MNGEGTMQVMSALFWRWRPKRQMPRAAASSSRCSMRRKRSRLDVDRQLEAVVKFAEIGILRGDALVVPGIEVRNERLVRSSIWASQHLTKDAQLAQPRPARRAAGARLELEARPGGQLNSGPSAGTGWPSRSSPPMSAMMSLTSFAKSAPAPGRGNDDDRDDLAVVGPGRVPAAGQAGEVGSRARGRPSARRSGRPSFRPRPS